jgi:hypothetical protein
LLTGAKRDAPWQLRLTEPAEVAKLIGEELLASFLKCFVGVDKILTYEQCFMWNAENLPSDSIASTRNLHVLSSATATTMYELKNALQDLKNAKVESKMTDTSNWAPLDRLRARWFKHPNVSEIRNELGAHLGKVETYKKGLAVLINEPEVILLTSDDARCRSGQFIGALDTLLRGLRIDNAEFKAALEEMSEAAHKQIHPLVTAAFLDVLETAGIPIDDQRT